LVKLIIAVVIGGIIAYLGLSVLVDGYFGGNIFPNGVTPDSWAAPNSWSNWRDIVIVLTAGFWVIAGLLMVVLLVVAIFLLLQIRKLLQQNVAPAVDSLRDSLDNLRGTTEFAGETVASPLIRTYSIVRGLRSGLSAITNLPDRVKGNKKKKKGRK
jgi:hypothetical protein